VVAYFVEVCQNQHNLAAADDVFHPEFVNHYAPGGRPVPVGQPPMEQWTARTSRPCARSCARATRRAAGGDHAEGRPTGPAT
jgi:hypothetical protein